MIKTCPFCGNEAKLRAQNELVGHGMTTTLYFVECTVCKAHGTEYDVYFEGYRNVENKAIDAWNARVKE